MSAACLRQAGTHRSNTPPAWNSRRADTRVRPYRVCELTPGNKHSREGLNERDRGIPNIITKTH
jgi:hypothetical protein